MGKLDKLALLKQGVGWVVGAGVANIVSEFVARVAPTETPIQKILVMSGRVGLSMLVVDKVKEHVDTKIDETVEWVNTTFSS